MAGLDPAIGVFKASLPGATPGATLEKPSRRLAGGGEALGQQIEAPDDAEHRRVDDEDVEEVVEDRDQRQDHPQRDAVAEAMGDEAVADGAAGPQHHQAGEKRQRRDRLVHHHNRVMHRVLPGLQARAPARPARGNGWLFL